MSTKLDFWKPIVGEDWYLNNRDIFDSDYMTNVLNEISAQYSKAVIFPLIQDIFLPFRLTPFNEVRVVILDKEPYTSGTESEPNATGLAFANPVDTLAVSPALKNIHTAVELYCYDGLKVQFDITLREWASQGVLLLNSSLTTNKYKPGSHIPIWDGFIKFIIQSLDKQKTGLHFVFLGDYVKRFEPLVNGLFHYKYDYTHPAKAVGVGKNWDCKIFRDINYNIIGQNGVEESIAW